MYKILLGFLFGILTVSTALASGSEPWVLAERHITTGDYFQAYRILLDLKQSDMKSFISNGVDLYVDALSVLQSDAGLLSECEELASSFETDLAVKGSYLCGLKFIQRRNPEVAEKFLSKIKKTYKLYWPAQILLVTGDFLRSEFDKAKKRLVPEDRPQYEALKLTAVYDLTMARLAAAEGKYEEAIRSYQAITSEDSHYLDALYETAWCFFKIKKPQTSRVLLDVVIPQYQQTGKVGGAKVSAATHYRARYLKSYLALTEEQEEEAKVEFQDLKFDFQRYLAKQFKSLQSATGLNVLSRNLGFWADMRGMPPAVGNQLKLITEWMGPDQSQQVFRSIQYQMALRREFRRIELNEGGADDELLKYKKQINQLLVGSEQALVIQYKIATKRLGKSINTLTLKADMGRLEMYWLGRSQGARSVDEVISSYKNQVEYINDYFEQ